MNRDDRAWMGRIEGKIVKIHDKLDNHAEKVTTTQALLKAHFSEHERSRNWRYVKFGGLITIATTLVSLGVNHFIGGIL